MQVKDITRGQVFWEVKDARDRLFVAMTDAVLIPDARMPEVQRWHVQAYDVAEKQIVKLVEADVCGPFGATLYSTSMTARFDVTGAADALDAFGLAMLDYFDFLTEADGRKE